jgi:hypothetical protein
VVDQNCRVHGVANLYICSLPDDCVSFVRICYSGLRDRAFALRLAKRTQTGGVEQANIGILR